jgi:Flp pilus assembly protein TadD
MFLGFTTISQTDQNQEAEEAFKLALQIYPDNPSPVGNLAMLKAPSEGSRINPEETSMASSGGADSAAFNALRLQFSNTLERELKRWPGFQRKDLIFLLPGTFGFIADPSLFAHMAGFYLRRMGNSERAIAASKLARNVSKIGKDSFSAILGDLLLYSGAPEEARLEWEKLLETNPDNQQLRLRLAATYLELGDFQKVEEVLADSNAQNAQILRTLAKSLEMQEQGDFLGSLEVLEELAEARPQDPIPQVILAQMAIASEEYPKARSHIAKAKRAGWSPFEADLMDAQIALAKGTPEEKERAVKLVERMLQTSPSDNRVINLKISIAMDEEDWDEARKWAEKMIELDNNSPVGYRALGFISMMEGDRSSATQYYQRAVLLQEDPSTLNNLSNLYYERGDLPLAEVTARKGIKLAPNDPYLLDTLGTILQKAGKSEEALGLFRKACEEAEFLPPATQATLYSHLGLLLAESQDPVRKLEAKTALGKAIELKDYLEESEQQKLEQALKTVNQ